MNDNDLLPVMLARASEKLRQEQETFNQKKVHENRWFVLRLVMGYSSVMLLATIMVIASYILLNSKEFYMEVVVTAGGALFADILGLFIGVWKIALNPNFLTKLEPVTEIKLPNIDSNFSDGNQ